MRKYVLFVGFLMLFSVQVSGQNWTDATIGSDGGEFTVSCTVLTTPLRGGGENAHRDLTLTLWQMIFSLIEQQGVELEGELLALSESLDSALSDCVSGTEDTESLTVKSTVWEESDGDLILIDMVVSDDSLCYIMIDVARDTEFTTPSQRMMARQQFITDCI